MTFRPLTSDHKVDLSQLAPPAERSLTDLLPPAPAVPTSAARAAPPRPRTSGRAQLAAAIVAGAVVLLLALFIGQSLPTPTPRVVDPPALASAPPAGPSAPAAPQPPRTALERLSRAVVAYAAPDGVVLGSIEPGRPYTATARLGLEWTRIAAEGSGLVWVRAAELPPASDLADLATPTQRPLPTAAPAPVVVVREAPPQPTQCATVRGGGVSVQRCGAAPLEQLDADARAAWAAQMGAPTKGATP